MSPLHDAPSPSVSPPLPHGDPPPRCHLSIIFPPHGITSLCASPPICVPSPRCLLPVCAPSPWHPLPMMSPLRGVPSPWCHLPTLSPPYGIPSLLCHLSMISPPHSATSLCTPAPSDAPSPRCPLHMCIPLPTLSPSCAHSKRCMELHDATALPATSVGSFCAPQTANFGVWGRGVLFSLPHSPFG